MFSPVNHYTDFRMDSDDERTTLRTPDFPRDDELSSSSSDPELPLNPDVPLEAASALPGTTDPGDIPFDRSKWLITNTLSGRLRRPRQYEFLEMLLNNPEYADYAHWSDDKKEMCTLDQPNKVVRLWEQVKQRQTREAMSYDTFARGLRTYYYEGGPMKKTNIKYTFCFNRD